jgi:hypothetical protein
MAAAWPSSDFLGPVSPCSRLKPGFQAGIKSEIRRTVFPPPKDRETRRVVTAGNDVAFFPTTGFVCKVGELGKAHSLIF